MGSSGINAEYMGKISFVDLAGSERAESARTSTSRLKETGAINRSLFVLNKVIAALAPAGSQSQSDARPFVPYRDSKLTLLMKDSIGGNAKTLMLVNISPESVNYEATQIALVYGSRAKTITNEVQKNVENSNLAKMNETYKKMQKWLESLADKLKESGVAVPEEISSGMSEVKENEAEAGQGSTKIGKKKRV
eukprot:TRINITY_DN6449_c0_g2_i1.p1 TRINITY_DN6449_c0_g2~~TRINITY_DN6449_c0_g2_i1.p1  ORF type:complete len:193 (+),score=74.26 TRINITY_DN6449_c0_g2_i1:109-687(+)